MLSIYIAGPDVFWPNAREAGARKVAACQTLGAKGVFPLDSELCLDELMPFDAGVAICRANMELMRDCDLVVANMTPFRGVSMDVGTAFEMGFMAALGRPVWGYTLDGRIYADRVLQKNTTGFDEQGCTIEQFDMADNLMMVGAAYLSGGDIEMQSSPQHLEEHVRLFSRVVHRALKAFERA